jgi:hypothetical protein
MPAGRAISDDTRFALYQGNIVLRVVTHIAASSSHG